MKFRIIREGGKFFIEHLHQGKKWVAFPKHKSEKFHSSEQAERWLVDNKNWQLIHQRELIKEIEINADEKAGFARCPGCEAIVGRKDKGAEDRLCDKCQTVMDITLIYPPTREEDILEWSARKERIKE